MTALDLTDVAKADVRDRAEYFLAFGWSSVQRFLDELDGVFVNLAEYPELGRERPELGVGTRSFPFRDHVVLYRRDSRGVLVLRVIHGSRDISPVPTADAPG